MYSGVDGELIAVSDPVPGEELRFLVTLTARRGAVRLDPCPDYSMAQYAAQDDSLEAPNGPALAIPTRSDGD